MQPQVRDKHLWPIFSTSGRSFYSALRSRTKESDEAIRRKYGIGVDRAPAGVDRLSAGLLYG
jgi:hypothetical protein